jgi:hypothetical protein
MGISPFHIVRQTNYLGGKFQAFRLLRVFTVADIRSVDHINRSDDVAALAKTPS